MDKDRWLDMDGWLAGWRGMDRGIDGYGMVMEGTGRMDRKDGQEGCTVMVDRREDGKDG